MNKSTIYSLLTLLLLTIGCDKSETESELSLPSMKTGESIDIKSNSATLSGEIISFGEGFQEISDYGFCYSNTNTSPTLDDSYISLGKSRSIGEYSVNVDGLINSTNYHYRAYGKNEKGVAYGNTLTFLTDSLEEASDSLQIGDFFGGGIIAYILEPNDTNYIEGEIHGLIIASADLNSGSNWSNVNDTLVGTNRAIGKGLENTNKIVHTQGDGDYAAKLCYDYSSGDYSDWYLPSMDELNLVHLNKNKINGNFMGNNWFYWTSTERDKHNAWAQCIESGEQRSDAGNKTIPYLVRPMRNF